MYGISRNYWNAKYLLEWLVGVVEKDSDSMTQTWTS